MLDMHEVAGSNPAVSTKNGKTATFVAVFLVFFILQKGNTLYIASDTLENGTWAKNLVHEVTHFAEGTKEYSKLMRHLTADQTLSETITNRLIADGNTYGFTKEDLLGLSEAVAEGKRPTGVSEELFSEINAHLADEVLGNESFVNRIVRSDASVAEKIMRKIQDLLASFRTLNDPAARKEYNRLQKAEKLYLKAVENAGWNYVAGKIQDAMGEEEDVELEVEDSTTDVQFSRKSFAQQVDDVLGGADTTSTHVRVMHTPKLLQDAGLPDLPILLTAQHLKSISQSGEENGADQKSGTNYHGLDVSLIKRLPEYIANPVLIADSFTREDSVVIITEAVDSNDRPVIAAIKLNGRGNLRNRYIKANILTSAYGKDNFQDFLNRIAAENATIYWNKEKSQALSVNLGVQFPNIITKLDSNIIIRKAKAFVNKNAKNNSEKVSYSMKSPKHEATEGERYTYDALTKKGDLSVVTLPKDIPLTTDGKIDNKDVIVRGKQNAQKQNNPNNTETSTYVHVDDIGQDVLLGAKGMQHGVARSTETALAVMKIGDILKNSIAVNELNGSEKRKTEMSYVLLGACQDAKNLYVVRSVVSKMQNNVTEIDIYQLGAVKGKKTETPTSALGGTAVTEQSSLIPSGSPVISIADFLQYVKGIPLANEIFSKDVLKKLGVSRSEGSLSGDVRYSMKQPQEDPNKVVMSKGARQKEKANYRNDKVFSRKDVANPMRESDAFMHLSRQNQSDLIDEIWYTYNRFSGEKNRKHHTDSLKKSVLAFIELNALSDEDVSRIKALRNKAEVIRKTDASDEQARAEQKRAEKDRQANDRNRGGHLSIVRRLRSATHQRDLRQRSNSLKCFA